MDDTAAPDAPRAGADNEGCFEGLVRFPLEGGVPIVTTPKEDAGPGVEKQLMRKGRTERRPKTTSKCFVHYQAWTASSGEEIDNTREDHEACQMMLAQAPADRAGLVIALLSMCEGERALFRVQSELAYGQQGHFSFPAVAANADIIYDVELLAVEDAGSGADSEVRARGDMLWEERMEAADRYRAEGNALFSSGDASGAAVKYLLAISFIDDGMMAQLMGRYLDDSTRLKCAIHLNLAGAYLKTSAFTDALQQCTFALAMDKSNAKAWFRKGKAHLRLGQDDAARGALAEARKLVPEDAAVRAALQQLDREEALKAKARKQVFGGLFGGAPQPASRDGGGEAFSASSAVPPPPPPESSSSGAVLQAGEGGGRSGSGADSESQQQREPQQKEGPQGRIGRLASWLLGS